MNQSSSLSLSVLLVIVECERPNQGHYEMIPFVIFNSKEIKNSKHHQHTHETSNNITVISNRGMCQLNNFGMFEVL
jgi:hypothetical protein